MCVTWLIHVRDMTHWYVRRDSLMCDMEHRYMRHDSLMWDMTHWYVWHDSLTCETWLIDVCNGALIYDTVMHDSFMCVTWIIDMCDMTHSCAWLDSFMSVTWLTHVCDMTHSCMWHDSLICVWYEALIHDALILTFVTSVMSHSTRNICVPLACVWHDSLICVTWLIHVCDMTHSYVCIMNYSYTTHSFIRLWLSVTSRSTPNIRVPFACVWHDSLMCVTWLILVCDLTHSYVCDMKHWYMTHSCICLWLRWRHALLQTYVCLLHVCDMTRSCVWHDSFLYVTWLTHMCVTW